MVTVDHQPDFADQRQHPRHLAQHTHLVHDRRALGDAMRQSFGDHDFSAVRVSGVVQHLGGGTLSAGLFAQSQQQPQAGVFLAQLLHLAGPNRLQRQLLGTGLFIGLRLLQAVEVAGAMAKRQHRLQSHPLQRHQHGRQAHAHRLGDVKT